MIAASMAETPAKRDDVSTLEHPNAPRAAVDLPALRLEVVRGASTGTTIALDATMPSRLYVGKSQACHLTIEDPLVSRRHFAVDRDGSRIRLIDLESKNGTFVNGVAVAEAFLFGGELVRVGETTIAIRALPNETARFSQASRFGRVLGQSPQMTRIHPICERLALSDVPIIVEGETGTGKELLAEALHEASPRARGPFVVFDCTTSGADLVAGRLFGHERDPVTGAVDRGVFEEASGGTLLIDEIGDLDIALQAKLLRAVESREVQRLGSTSWIKTDVRIIATTRRDLEREIQAGRFRDDLYYRLAGARVELPPLRRRTGDIPLLARHFWSSLTNERSSVPADLIARFESYGWPGNVRELQSAVSHHVALGEHADADTLRRLDRPTPSAAGDAVRDVVGEVIAEGLSFPQARQRVLEAFEERYVDAVLERNGGNISKAAESAGIARRYFFTIRSRRGR
jgi:two-component system response regulator HydG